jgi:hypothetical protein
LVGTFRYDFFGGKPYFPQKGGNGPLFEEKGGTSPLFDTASPPFAEKRSSRQICNTNRKYRPPNKSDTAKIPIPKKLLVTPWYTTLVLCVVSVSYVQYYRSVAARSNSTVKLDLVVTPLGAMPISSSLGDAKNYR